MRWVAGIGTIPIAFRARLDGGVSQLVTGEHPEDQRVGPGEDLLYLGHGSIHRARVEDPWHALERQGGHGAGRVLDPVARDRLVLAKVSNHPVADEDEAMVGVLLVGPGLGVAHREAPGELAQQ